MYAARLQIGRRIVVSLLDRFKKKKGAGKRSGPTTKPSETLTADHTEEPAKDPAEAQEDTAASVISFYNDCVEDFHKAAMEEGRAKNGLIFIPELIPIGEKTVLAFLKDPFFRMQFDNNPQMFYYVIMSLSLQAGMVFGAKWHEDFAALNDEYVDRIIREGPADACKPCLKQMGISDSIKENAFYRVIFGRWTAMHEPYWEMRDPREYTFRAILAAYQLGVSMILGEYGY